MKYIVKTPVDHDNKAYTPGKPIDLDDEQAEALLAVGAIEPAPKAPAKEDPKK